MGEGLFMERALPLRWSGPEPAPQIAATGTWPNSPRAAQETASASTWRRLVVTRVEEESESARSFYLAPQDGADLAPHRPGQFLPIALDIPGEPRPLRRTYTISGATAVREYRLTVKRGARADGLSISNWLHDHARPGTLIQALAPRGDFVLDAASVRPVVLLSAGIGITPMIAMLGGLTRDPAGRPERPVFFIHAARHSGEHVFAGHLRRLAARNANLTVHVRYSRPRAADIPGRDYDSTGRIDKALLQSLLPRDDYDVHGLYSSRAVS
jgi:ferredoxin-NADP reductase